MQPDDDDRSTRAGFWRRTLAIVADALSVSVPCAVLSALLFSASGGRIQAAVGLDFNVCERRTSVPDSLVPAPPRDSNFAAECHRRSLAGPTGHVLLVGRAMRTATFSTQVSRSYLLGDDGAVVDGVDWSWGAPGLLLLYLVLGQWRWGRTLGLRAAGLRLSLRGGPRTGKVPLGRVLLRYALGIGGYLPMIVVIAVVLSRIQTGPEGAAPSFAGLGLALLFGAVWSLWNMVLIVRKRDPLYDRWAGTALVRLSVT